MFWWWNVAVVAVEAEVAEVRAPVVSAGMSQVWIVQVECEYVLGMTRQGQSFSFSGTLIPYFPFPYLLLL